jgi:hypothetical protein
VIELLMASAARYVASRPDLLEDGVAPPPAVARSRGGVRAVLYTLLLVAGILLLPRIAAFGYFAIAAIAVLSPRGEGRLTLSGLN